MNSAAINLDKLHELITTLRQSGLPAKERRAICDQILLSLDIVKKTDIENLLCIQHAAEARGYANRSSVYRTADRNSLHVFKVCCRSFYLRSEIERAPKSKGTTGRVRKVRVGM